MWHGINAYTCKFVTWKNVYAEQKNVRFYDEGERRRRISRLVSRVFGTRRRRTWLFFSPLPWISPEKSVVILPFLTISKRVFVFKPAMPIMAWFLCRPDHNVFTPVDLLAAAYMHEHACDKWHLYCAQCAAPTGRMSSVDKAYEICTIFANLRLLLVWISFSLRNTKRTPTDSRP